MKKEIIKIFNEGSDVSLPTEEIRGGWCGINVTCTSTATNCNSYVVAAKKDTTQKKEIVILPDTTNTTSVRPIKK